MPARRVPLELRFWEKVQKSPDENGCWIWTANHTPNGYGQIKFAGKSVLAHRAAYFIETGRWPENQVLHHCDNKPCVRFDHLFEGSHQDNMDDSSRKGRRAKKLTRQKAIEIRNVYSGGWGEMRVLARRYGVSHQTINSILKRKFWK